MSDTMPDTSATGDRNSIEAAFIDKLMALAEEARAEGYAAGYKDGKDGHDADPAYQPAADD